MKEIQEETELEINRTEALNSARQKVAAELSQRLRELKLSNSEATEKGWLLLSVHFHLLLLLSIVFRSF